MTKDECCDRCKTSFYATGCKHIEFHYGHYGEPAFFSLCDACSKLWKPICESTGYYEAKEIYKKAVDLFLADISEDVKKG